eukprot:9608680-Alexandrium_andersonii.AAC.1
MSRPKSTAVASCCAPAQCTMKNGAKSEGRDAAFSRGSRAGCLKYNHEHVLAKAERSFRPQLT